MQEIIPDGNGDLPRERRIDSLDGIYCIYPDYTKQDGLYTTFLKGAVRTWVDVSTKLKENDEASYDESLLRAAILLNLLPQDEDWNLTLRNQIYDGISGRNLGPEWQIVELGRLARSTDPRSAMESLNILRGAAVALVNTDQVPALVEEGKKALDAQADLEALLIKQQNLVF